MQRTPERMMRPFATLIAGPTASGKSARAIRLAMERGATIVNADSMQVYADLRILSARPTLEEERMAPHRLFGFVGAGDEYSVGRYLTDVAPLIEEARAEGPSIIIVGGTGLYFRALTEGLVPTPPVPASIRDYWRGAAATGTDLYAELVRRDPARAAVLAPADTPRLLRAIELHDATGRAYSDWLKENPGEPMLRAGEWVGEYIQPDRDWLHSRIDRRFDAMMEEGALEEARHLLSLQPPLAANLGVMKAHGMPHLAAHLAGTMSREEAVQRGKQDTRAYARRQGVFARRYFIGAGWRWLASAGDA